MNPDLERLIHLQHAESELRRGEAALAEIPQRRGAQQDELAQERARLDSARSGLADAQKTRRTLEGELQALETKRSKYKGQLMEVKTNKEYTAMLHEIEAVEREIRGIEDRILVEMERAESGAGEIKREEQHFKAVEERHKVVAAEVEKEASQLQTRVEALRKERDEVATSVSEDALALFHRVAKQRNGVAVSQAREGMCLQCHVRLRPQMFLDLKRNEEIVQCPSCGRILYYEPPPPEVVPQP